MFNDYPSLYSGPSFIDKKKAISFSLVSVLTEESENNRINRKKKSLESSEIRRRRYRDLVGALCGFYSLTGVANQGSQDRMCVQWVWTYVRGTSITHVSVQIKAWKSLLNKRGNHHFLTRKIFCNSHSPLFFITNEKESSK